MKSNLLLLMSQKRLELDRFEPHEDTTRLDLAELRLLKAGQDLSKEVEMRLDLEIFGRHYLRLLIVQTMMMVMMMRMRMMRNQEWLEHQLTSITRRGFRHCRRRRVLMAIMMMMMMMLLLMLMMC